MALEKGRVTVRDVQQAATTDATPTAPVAVQRPTQIQREERVKMTPLRRTIARRLVEASTNSKYAHNI